MPRTGRPRAFDRDQALVGAMHLFWQDGFAGASLERLRDVMGGLSSASFYAAFGSKAALYREALAHYAATHGGALGPLRDEALPPRERLQQALRRSIEMQADPSHPAGCMVALGAGAGMGGEADLASLTMLERAANRASIAACVRAGVASGELRPETSEAGLTALLCALLVGLSVEIVDGVSASALQDAITTAMTVWDAASI